MGTRSTVKFYDNGNIVLSCYIQYDGYIKGVGYDLAEWLKDKKNLDGFNSESHTIENGFANGIGCLAAQFVASNKTKVGGFYLTSISDIQEYNYCVQYTNDSFLIEVDNDKGRTIFSGTPNELLEFEEK